jgi:RNA polymerase sigma factor (sigma-70 family)
MILSPNNDLLARLKQAEISGTVKQLYDHYFEGIIAQVCVNGGSREDGADIFQEAVLILIEKVQNGQFRGESSIKTFLSAIARNLWLHELRTRNRRAKREVIYMNADEKLELPVEKSIYRECDNDLLELFGQIGDTCKKILSGFYYEDKSMKELLGQFNYQNEQVLRNKKSGCMKKLKELLTKNATLLNHLKSMHFYEQ